MAGLFAIAGSASGSTSQPLRFAARELDATAGLYYVRARWYDAGMGRFISEDPIGLAGGINNYAYALNDPVNLSDPTGLCVGSRYNADTTTCLLGGETSTGSPFNINSMIDQVFSLGGRASTMAGVVFGSDDGSGVVNKRSVPQSESLLSDDCKKKIVLTGLQGIGDFLALSGVGGAWRALQATGQASRIANRRAVQPLVVTQLERAAAWAQFRSETAKAITGVVVQLGTGYVQGDSLDYGIPLWGLGRRAYDATRACLGN